MNLNELITRLIERNTYMGRLSSLDYFKDVTAMQHSGAVKMNLYTSTLRQKSTQYLVLIQAWMDGKTIQSRAYRINLGKWTTTEHPLWNFTLMEYRIKPNKED